MCIATQWREHFTRIHSRIRTIHSGLHCLFCLLKISILIRLISTLRTRNATTTMDDDLCICRGSCYARYIVGVYRDVNDSHTRYTEQNYRNTNIYPIYSNLQINRMCSFWVRSNSISTRMLSAHSSQLIYIFVSPFECKLVKRFAWLKRFERNLYS